MSILWGEADQERLTATSSDEAIEEFLDACSAESQPDHVTVCEYKQLEVSVEGLAEVALETTLEWLDENFGGPDDYTHPSSDAMRAAARVFAEALVCNYHVWLHEPTGHQVTVESQAWIQQHRPDWLEPKLVSGKLFRAANVKSADIGKQDYHCTMVKREDGLVEVLDEGLEVARNRAAYAKAEPGQEEVAGFLSAAACALAQKSDPASSPTKTHRWEDIKKQRFSVETLEELDTAVKKELIEIDEDT